MPRNAAAGAAAVLLILAATACAAAPGISSASGTLGHFHDASTEQGVVVRVQLIRGGENGPYVGTTTLLADGSGWDRSGEAAADRDALEAAKRVTGQAADRLGASYIVKLACGGVVYIFEPGAARLSVAQSVMVEHGFTPRIVR